MQTQKEAKEEHTNRKKIPTLQSGYINSPFLAKVLSLGIAIQIVAIFLGCSCSTYRVSYRDLEII
jgi:hypothetical protein